MEFKMKGFIVFLIMVITGCSIFSTYYFSQIYNLKKYESMQKNTDKVFGY